MAQNEEDYDLWGAISASVTPQAGTRRIASTPKKMSVAEDWGSIERRLPASFL